MKMLHSILLLICCQLGLNHSCLQAQETWKYDLGEGAPAKGFIKVVPSNKYRAVPGYGFESTEGLTAVQNPATEGAAADYITSDRPYCFSVKLPEGNYEVMVLWGDTKGTAALTIKAECRRLMVEKRTTAYGQLDTVTFTVHIRDSMLTGKGAVRLKPRERDYRHWDDKLTLEFNNTAPKICAVMIRKAARVPTVFLAGNSTVVDQANEPWASWGQMFPAFLQPQKVCVANYAESGETLKAFERERRLEKIWNNAQAGDYLFIEFAHNDQKPGGNHLDAFTSYKQVLKAWIAAARKRKVTPVLVTSVNRRRFDAAGLLINTLEGYPEAMRQTGEEEKVTVLDLNAMSKILFEALGPAQSIKAFVHFPANSFPDQPQALKDDTHFSAYGAYELAKCLVQALSRSDLPLKNYIVNSFTGFDPSRPDAFESFNFPASRSAEGAKPDGN